MFKQLMKELVETQTTPAKWYPLKIQVYFGLLKDFIQKSDKKIFVSC